MSRILVLVTATLAVVAAAAPAHGQSADDVVVYAGGFDFLTNLAIAPDGTIFAAEKDRGDIMLVRDGRVLQKPFAHLDVYSGAERGLLGLALHPEYPKEPWLYVYYSDAEDERNRVVRIRDEDGRGGAVEPIIDGLAAVSGYHNGGDISFGPDGNLYIVTGEAHVPETAQAPDDVGGKVLRVTDTGGVPQDNPFGPGSPVYSLGHRNSFGLCIDPETGQVWETENGPGSHDEVNRILPGENYGWPEASGPGGEPEFVDPVIDYPEVIVVTGCAVVGRRLMWGDFGVGQIHVAEIQGDGLGAEDVIDLGTGVTDLAFRPADGFLYMAAGSEILRMRVAQPADTPSPTSPPAESPETTSSPAASPSPSGGRRESTASIIVVAILLAIGIVVMRGRIRPPDEPIDPTKV